MFLKELLNHRTARIGSCQVVGSPKCAVEACRLVDLHRCSPIFYHKASKGEQFRHNHGIDPKLMCQVPLLLEDPVLIYNSPNSNSRICVVLNQVDGDKSPLLAVLQPNSKSGLHDGMRYANSNFLITVFGKNNVDSQLRYKVPPSEVLYINKEKSQEIERISGIQFPRDYSSLDSNTIIRLPRCICNDGYEPRPWLDHAKGRSRHHEPQQHRRDTEANDRAGVPDMATVLKDAAASKGHREQRVQRSGHDGR